MGTDGEPNAGTLDLKYEAAVAAARTAHPWLRDDLLRQIAEDRVRLDWYNEQVETLLNFTGDSFRYRREVFDRFCSNGLFEQRLQSLRGRLLAMGLITREQYESIQATPPKTPEQIAAMQAELDEYNALKARLDDIFDNVTDREYARFMYSNLGDSPRTSEKLDRFVGNLKAAGMLPATYGTGRLVGQVAEAVKKAAHGFAWEGEGN